MDLDHAIQAHAEWKVKLRAAIAKKDILDAAAISTDKHCPLGKWLHAEARQALGHTTSYARCVEDHAAFHKEAGKVAQAINARRYNEAESMLAAGTPYAKTSSAVGVAIIQLKQESRV